MNYAFDVDCQLFSEAERKRIGKSTPSRILLELAQANQDLLVGINAVVCVLEGSEVARSELQMGDESPDKPLHPSVVGGLYLMLRASCDNMMHRTEMSARHISQLLKEESSKHEKLYACAAAEPDTAGLSSGKGGS